MAHESIMVYRPPGARPSDCYYSADDLRTAGHANYSRRAVPSRPSAYRAESGLSNTRARSVSDGTRSPSSILRFGNKACMPAREKTPHPTQKPLDLCAYLVRGHCPPGGLVCDPYAGSGSVLVAARAAGRRYIGAEKSPEWHALAAGRLRSVLSYDDDG